MEHLEISWPPRVGDRVSIKGSRLVGIVRAITRGTGSSRRFVVSVRAPNAGDSEDHFSLVADAECAPTVYTLDQLAPL